MIYFENVRLQSVLLLCHRLIFKVWSDFLVSLFNSLFHDFFDEKHTPLIMV